MNPFLEFHSKYNIYKNSMRKKKNCKTTKMLSDIRILQSFSPHPKVKFNVAPPNDF